MKKLCIGLLIFAAVLTEIQLFISWYLPYTDFKGIEFIYGVSMACRLIIYVLILIGYDYLWIKYISHNTIAYRKGLIQLYKDQIHGERSAYMVTVLHSAILKLETGDNPTEVEDYVVRAEKKWRSKK